MIKKHQNSFTIIELLIVFLIIAILVAIILTGLKKFQTKTTLDKNTQSALQFFRLAKNQATVSKNDANAGIYIETNKLVLFEGATYNPIDSKNQTLNLDNEITINEINLNPATNTASVIFTKMTGFTDNYGWIKLQSLKDTNQNQLIYIEPSGQISLASNTATSNLYRSDSRHTHLILTRPIDTLTEKIYLFFDGAGTAQQTIDLATNLVAGQIDWSGTVSINGSPQQIQIHTHELNSPNSIICVHRDQRYNNKSLKIDLATDNLINYAASGTLTQGSSIGISSPQTQ